jgi:hypothetical protein
MIFTVMIIISTGVFFKKAPEEAYNPENKKKENTVNI